MAMVNAYEISDYSAARMDADNVKACAEKIMNIFSSVDADMDKLYNSVWISEGADGARNRYNEYKRNYEKFYEAVLEMHTQIHKIVDTQEAADIKNSQNVAGI